MGGSVHRTAGPFLVATEYRTFQPLRDWEVIERVKAIGTKDAFLEKLNALIAESEQPAKCP